MADRETLSALVAAYDADAAGLRALQPLAGVTLLEHQVRRLEAAGVARIVLLLEEWPPALAPALQRLRADRIAVDTVTSIADAADRLGGEARILLLANGCLPDRALVETLAGSPAPMLATLSDTPDHADFERIDAADRWAGVALLDGRALLDTAAIVGEWDPVSTLLRRAVQQGADRVAVEGDPPILAADPAALDIAERRLLAQSREPARGWAARFIEAPAVELLMPRLFAHGIGATGPAMAAPVLAVIGGLLALAGKPALGLACLLPTGILERIAGRLALVQARRLPRARALHRARIAGMALAAIGLGAALRGWTLQWGWALLGLLVPAAMMARNRLHILVGREEEPSWLATIASLPWLSLPFAIAGRWDIGLAALSLYTLASATWLLWRATEAQPEGQRPS